MDTHADIEQKLQSSVRAALASGTPLQILGQDSKGFFGRRCSGEPLDAAEHRGVIAYEPSELFIRARGGTPLREIERLLAEHRQQLPFEPPRFEGRGTLGGAIAAGLSGPGRPWGGAARDVVLGVRLLTGDGRVVSFGGTVIKNVAGYDLSRLMAGAMGTLGVLLDISVKVLPSPRGEATLVQDRSAEQALRDLPDLMGRALPLSAAAHGGERLYLRLSGTDERLNSLRERLGGEWLPDDRAFWNSVRDQTHPFFLGAVPLWRLSLPPATAPLPLAGEWLHEWGGALRWLKSEEEAATIRSSVEKVGGHAILFRNGDRESQVFHPLAPPLLALQKRLKKTFDPGGILNPGRVYPDW